MYYLRFLFYADVQYLILWVLVYFRSDTCFSYRSDLQGRRFVCAGGFHTDGGSVSEPGSHFRPRGVTSTDWARASWTGRRDTWPLLAHPAQAFPVRGHMSTPGGFGRSTLPLCGKLCRRFWAPESGASARNRGHRGNYDICFCGP